MGSEVRHHGMSIPGGRDPADQNVENPGAWLRRFELSERVVSCEEAADAKGVPLHHELKSLLLICDHGYALAHLHGDRRLSLRAVKDAMGTRQARLAAQSELRQLGLDSGTVQPFHERLWNIPQLLERKLLLLPWVTTNAGQLDRYFIFDPAVLLRANNLTLASLEL